MENYCFSSGGRGFLAIARKLLKQVSQKVALQVEASGSRAVPSWVFKCLLTPMLWHRVGLRSLEHELNLRKHCQRKRIIRIMNRWTERLKFFSVRWEFDDHSVTIRCQYNPAVTKIHLFLVCIRGCFQQRWGITLLKHDLFTWARKLGEDVLAVDT